MHAVVYVLTDVRVLAILISLLVSETERFRQQISRQNRSMQL